MDQPRPSLWRGGAFGAPRFRKLGTDRALSCTLHPTPRVLHLTPCTLHPTPYILRPTFHTLHPTLHTPHPTPYTRTEWGGVDIGARQCRQNGCACPPRVPCAASSSSFLLLSSLELSDTTIYEPSIRALLGIASHFCECFACKLPLSLYGASHGVSLCYSMLSVSAN